MINFLPFFFYFAPLQARGGRKERERRGEEFHRMSMNFPFSVKLPFVEVEVEEEEADLDM